MTLTALTSQHSARLRKSAFESSHSQISTNRQKT